MKTIFLTMAWAAVLTAGPCVRAEGEIPQVRLKDLKIETAKPVEGVFRTYTGYETTVLELKAGRYRYWFESDEKDAGEPQYPLTGTYSIKGDTIELSDQEKKLHQRTWTFLSVNGVVSLWRQEAVERKATIIISDLAFFKRYGGGSILVPTKQSADDAWTKRTAPAFPVPGEGGVRWRRRLGRRHSSPAPKLTL
ncbi:MAG: hypothetical protein QM755_14845 [Luteolibacter sp.]